MNKELLKEKVSKVGKKNIAIGVLSVALLGVIADDIHTQNNVMKFKNEAIELEEVIKEKDATVNSLEEENKKLQEKVDEAKPYFEMKEEERRKALLDAEKEKYKKYLDLVDSGKSYYDMTEEERKTMDEFLDEASPLSYQKLSDELKEEYKEKYDKAKKDKEDSLVKIQADAEAKAKAEADAEAKAKAEAEAHKYETGLTWEDIARNGKVGTYGKFEGKIVQVMNGSGFKQYRIAINGDYDTVMLVEVQNDVAKEILLEDDYVYFKGFSMGQYTYTTVLGSELTIPSFEAEEITR